MDFPLTDELKALLASSDCQQWMAKHIKGSAHPAWDSSDNLCFRISDGEEASKFRERWLE